MNIVGICGPSCSGKSTITSLVAKHFDANVLSLDNFFKIEYQKEYVKYKGELVRSFEKPWLYDGEYLAKIIQELQEKGEVNYLARPSVVDKHNEKYSLSKKNNLLVEGFHIYNFASIRELCNTRIYLHLPFHAQLERRQKRGGRGVSDEAYAKIGEQEYKQYVLPQQNHATHILDATKKPTDLVNILVEIISPQSL